MPDENRIALKIDLANGTIELDAPAASFDHAIEKTRELAGSLDFRGAATARQADAAVAVNPREEGSSIPSAPTPAPPTRSRARSGKSGSSARPGRIGSFEAIPHFLTEAQEIELRSEMSTKAATAEQADQILVAIVKGEQLLGRRGFSFNEIYTLLWLSGLKDLPKALDVVLQRLLKDQMVVRENGGFAAKFLGRNRVERDLPTASNS